jgi:hypothetical protein
MRYRQMREAYPVAAERGRLMTAHLMASDPEARKRGEDAFGVDFCRNMYPEAYRSGFGRALDRLRALTPWY